MSRSSVITMTTGQGGGGKSYCRCARFLVDEWIPDYTGVHWSNFPILFDGLLAACREKHGDAWTAEAIAERVRVIPEDEFQRWMSGQSGPWEFFRGVSLKGAHIAIDEAHHVVGKECKREVVERWGRWLGEIRHQGATVEFLTQDASGIHRVVRGRAGLWYEVTNSETRRDPFFGIEMETWYQLRAKLGAQYKPGIWLAEYRQTLGRWRMQDQRVFWLDKFYYQVYNSYSAPASGDGDSGAPPEMPYQRWGWPRFLWWMFARNAWRISSRLAIAVFILYLISGGGGTLFKGFLTMFVPSMRAMVDKNKPHEIGEPPAGGQVVKEGQFPNSWGGSGKGRGLEVNGGTGATSQPASEVVLQLEKELDAERQRVAKLTADIEAASAIGMIQPMRVVMRGGGSYLLGEVITDGTYKGRRIVAVDARRRFVGLDDGTLLFMRARVSADDGKEGGRVRERVPGDESGTRRDKSSSRASGKTGTAFGSRFASSGVRSGVERSDGDIGSRGAGFRQSAGNVGSAGGTGVASPGGSRAPVGREFDLQR